MKKTSLLAVILYGLCAVIWTVRVVLEVVYQTYTYSIPWFILNVFCAIIWTVGFVLNLKRYRAQKEEA